MKTREENPPKAARSALRLSALLCIISTCKFSIFLLYFSLETFSEHKFYIKRPFQLEDASSHAMVIFDASDDWCMCSILKSNIDKSSVSAHTSDMKTDWKHLPPLGVTKCLPSTPRVYAVLQISSRPPHYVTINQTLWWYVRRELYNSMFYLE